MDGIVGNTFPFNAKWEFFYFGQYNGKSFYIERHMTN